MRTCPRTGDRSTQPTDQSTDAVGQSFHRAIDPPRRNDPARSSSDVTVYATLKEYVVVMIGNKKSMDQITHDLVDFIGDEHAQEFVKWLSAMLPTLESGDATNDDDGDDLAPPTEDNKSTQGEPAKRIISLKSVTSSSTATTEKKVVSLTGSGSSGGTIRSLNRSGEDLRDMLARRSQRFGVTTASPNRKDSQSKNKDKENDRGTKRKAEDKDKRPGSAGSRVSQLLGPPVTVDQAELDARDSLNTNKRKKTGRGGDDRDNRGGKKFDRDSQKDGDGNDRRQNRRRQDKDETNGDQPPLPPSPTGDRDRNRGGRNDRNDRDGRDPRGPPHQGNFRGPPGFGGYPPPPFGHPMYFPPPYGMGMPPYGMGFAPHHQGPFVGPPMPQGPPKQHFQPRGAPRPFQNKTWVNPNAAKPEGETTADGNAAGGAGGANAGPGGAAPFNSKPTNYVPRNPYYAQSQMRPRFQNKTWVRQDPAKEEQLSNSLPQTPPPEEAKNDSAME